jgi:hypothetical protein
MKIIITLVLFSLSTFSIGQTINTLKNSDKIDLSVVNEDELNKIFQEMKTSKLFKMQDCNNCEDRANAIAYILQKRGFTVAKFWLFGEGKISIGKSGYLLQSKKCGTWGYHVAVGLKLDKNGITETVIIDPATKDSPVTLDNWAASLIQKNQIGFLIIKDPKFYSYPVNNNKFQADDLWLKTDDNLWKTAGGLCGFKPNQTGEDYKSARKRFKERIKVKSEELKSYK